MSRVHKFSMKVPLYEIDLGGGVYHGNYYHFFDLARESMFDDMGYSYQSIMKNRNHLTVAEAHCKYLAPLGCHEKITILSSIIKITEKSLILKHEIWDQQLESQKTDLVISLVCINHLCCSVILPAPLRKAIISWNSL